MVERFWDNVSQMMNARDLSASELSRRLGKSDNYIHQCMKDMRSPSLELAVGIGEIFGVDPFWLLKEGAARQYRRDVLMEKKKEIEMELAAYED